MCGIVAYLGNEPFVKFIINGLHFLLNRGYDSVGISTILDNKIATIKEASSTTCNSLKLVEKEVLTRNFTSTVGIGHTRWATHGGKTRENAHPHSDNNGRISLVHNGIIENYAELKCALQKRGYTFHSQTDTEVVAVLIGSRLDAGLTMPEAFREAISQLAGTWALVAIHADYPNHMWITRNGSPLLLGMEDTCVMVASESIAFGNCIEKYVVLENHDIIEIHCSNTGAITYSNNIHTYAVQTKLAAEIETKPAEYEHWMHKEIAEQSAAAIRAMNNKGRITKTGIIKLGGLEKMCDKLAGIKHLILLGCGTSYHAGLWASELFKKTGVFDTVAVYDGAEFGEKDVPKKGAVAAIFLSQSGETKDLHRCIEIAKSRDILKIGVVNVVDSMIARETDCGVYLNAGREVAVASTKSFTNQCVVLAMVSAWFSQLHSELINKSILQDLYNLPFHLQNAVNRLSEIEMMLDGWHEKSTIFLLGKGQQEAIAKEGSLKIKEIAYIHAEGYSSSALKHGAIALIDDGLPIILLDIGDEWRDKNQNAYSEILARGADVLIISDLVYKEGKVLTVEHNPTFGGVIANVYLQWISYLLALKKGNHPDYPRNLAKVVTVE
jgi:glucosamine--fructose-6-phosphate aminotransferase (isomerizing)